MVFLIGVSSCVKDKKDNGPQIPDYTLVNSSNWTTLGKDVIGAGNSGGIQLLNLALNQVSPDVLRWMYAVSNPNYTNNHHEMRLNTAGQFSILDAFTAETYRFHLKWMYGGHEWQMNTDADGNHRLFTFKDGILVDGGHLTANVADFPRYQDFMELASDGFLVSALNSGWQSAFFSFQTQTWKINWIQNAGRCAQTRYAGKTMAVMLSDAEVEIYTEGNTLIEDNGHNYYRMTRLKSMATPGGYSGQLVYSVLYGKYFYMAMENPADNTLRIFKLNMETLDFTLVQKHNLSARLQSSTQQMYYDQAVLDNNNQIAIDEAGNTYVVERIEEQFSIRKYSVTGGSEVVLNNEELKAGTSVLCIRLFNGKLHAGLLYQQLDQSVNTHYYYNYMQLVRMN